MPYDHINELLNSMNKPRTLTARPQADAPRPVCRPDESRSSTNGTKLLPYYVAEPEDLDVVHFGERHINGQFGGQVFVVHRIGNRFEGCRDVTTHSPEITSFTVST